MRKYLLVVSALAAAMAVAAPVAFGASPNVSSIDGKFNPANPGATLKAGGLFVETTSLHATDAGTPTSPTKEPVPTTHVDVSFDHNIAFAPGTVPVCNDPLTGTAQAGMKACGNAYVGGGYGTLCASSTGPGGASGCDLGVLNATVAAYHGPNNPQPTIVLQGVADHTPLGPLTVVLAGTLRAANQTGEFAGGKRLDVPVPLLAGGARCAHRLLGERQQRQLRQGEVRR